jgi:hypothetical protein
MAPRAGPDWNEAMVSVVDVTIVESLPSLYR